MMKCKVFISDEGFGPIVRQRAITEELNRLDGTILFTLQTRKNLNVVKRMIPGSRYQNRFNNIEWMKSADGSPDVVATSKIFAGYNLRSDSMMKKELSECDSDFFISDLVYEAFEVAHKKSIPSFGVAHFTWDWFFSKLYPPPLEAKVLKRFFDYASKADVIYFPPFTPGEILSHYKKNAKKVPLIIRKNIRHRKISKPGKFNVLLVDSGAGVLKNSILKSLKKIGNLTDFHFFVSSAFASKYGNVSFIHKDDFFIDYISDMDLVIGRAGFNTISECIALRTPMLLLSEEFNPELNENMVSLKKSGMGSFISLNDFENNLARVLPRFVKNEYKTLKENMQNHDFGTDGAEVIARDILNKL